MTDQLGTFLLPTIVTGTFPWPNNELLVLPHGYIHSILGVTVISPESACDCDLVENAGCSFVHSDTYGYIFVQRLAGGCACGRIGMPYQARVAYQAGLSTGTASKSNVLLSLAIVAQINLNEMTDPGANEGTGDVGILEFSNQEYSEKRKELKNTAFGNSAKANKAAQLVMGLRRKRALKL